MVYWTAVSSNGLNAQPISTNLRSSHMKEMSDTRLRYLLVVNAQLDEMGRDVIGHVLSTIPTRAAAIAFLVAIVPRMTTFKSEEEQDKGSRCENAKEKRSNPIGRVVPAVRV